MPSISLTDLVDVVSKAGSPKATKVGEIKNRKSYQPATDFYKPLRDGLLNIHQKGEGRKSLDMLLGSIHDPKKLGNYVTALDGYSKWWGKKSLVWFVPPRSIYSHGGIDVAINPELGLEINGTRYIIKLYLKSDALTKLRVDLITVLMESALRPKCQASDVVALLDVRNSKLFTLDAKIKPLNAVINAELAYIAALWPSV